MNSQWVRSASAAWSRPLRLISALLLASACGQTERDEGTKSEDPPKAVAPGQECNHYSLSEYCESRICPANEAEAEDEALRNCPTGVGGFVTHRQPTTCGGTALGGFAGYRFFDAEGKLLGATVTLDVGSNGCGDGVPGMGKTMVYGEVCALTGEPVNLCPVP
jgi:hypothetical protein